MKIIITACGKSSRFTSCGYPEKTLIKIKDRYVIEHVMDMYLGVPYEDMIFIIKDNDDRLNQVLIDQYPGCTIKKIAPHSDGPVSSIIDADIQIDPNEQVIINYCDIKSIWIFEDFVNYVKEEDFDACMVVHRGYHMNRIYNDYFAYVKSVGKKIIEVKEKECFTDDPSSEFASSGTYYFKRFSEMLLYFNKLLHSGKKTNREFYVTIPYQLMLDDNKNVGLYETEQFIGFGIPKDVELINTFISLEKFNITDEESLIKAYRYWNKANE